MSEPIVFQAVGKDTDVSRVKVYRRMLVGPWCNQPEEYEGYNGFVGWAGLTILRSGRWLLPFTSGYWHGSWPLTEKILKDPKNLTFYQDMKKFGMPYVIAPRGGRAHLMVSDDHGLTWTSPKTLIDTDCDDRHPSILELADGTLVCNFFQGKMPDYCQARYMLSHDGGQIWSEPKATPGKGGGFGANPMIQLSDGSMVWVMDGHYEPKVEHTVVGVFRSENRGKSFEMVSVVNPGHTMDEPSVVELPDQRLMLIGRRKDDVCWSTDGGRSWTQPVSFGVELFDPHLVLLSNGMVACFHGSYEGGGLRVILSKDCGKTWHGPKDKIGYSVDPHVYGYSAPVVLKDGTIYVAYIHTGGHLPSDARTEALWGLRVKVCDNADGIEILPAPGSPSAKGIKSELSGLEMLTTHGGDPELGELRRS